MSLFLAIYTVVGGVTFAACAYFERDLKSATLSAIFWPVYGIATAFFVVCFLVALSSLLMRRVPPTA